MCLSKLFLDRWSDTPVYEDIAHIHILEDRVQLETLLGEEKTVQGKVIEVDFTSSRILLETPSINKA